MLKLKSRVSALSKWLTWDLNPTFYLKLYCFQEKVLGVLTKNTFLKASQVPLAKKSQSSSKNFARTKLLILLPQLATKMKSCRGKAKDRIVFFYPTLLAYLLPTPLVHTDL